MKLQELFKTPEHWTQNSFARDSDGNKLEEPSESAVCFCLLGALQKYHGGNIQKAVFRIIRYLEKDKSFVFDAKLSYESNLIRWNDDPSRTIEDIQKLVKDLDL